MPRGIKDLRKLSHVKKLKWAENEMIVVSDTLKKAFEGSGSLADMRVSIQACRAFMQSIRDQVRYHAVKNQEEQEDEGQDVVEID